MLLFGKLGYEIKLTEFSSAHFEVSVKSCHCQLNNINRTFTDVKLASKYFGSYVEILAALPGPQYAVI